MALCISTSVAATFNFTTGGTTYTIVEADPFASGGTAGNTTAVGGGYFSASGQSATTMRDRTVGAFNTGYEGILGATDRVFDNTVSGPETVTTVSGLTAGQYNVFIVYLYADPDGTQGDDSMGLQAKLNGAVDGTVYNVLNITEKMAVNPVVTWAVGLAPLGTTAAGATGFTVNLDDAETASPAQARIDYIGVAYTGIVDSDGDGMDDNWENNNGLVVGVDDSALDEDANGGPDGLTNFQEYNLGTDPQDSDTDNDGLLDGVETDTGTYVSPTDTGTNPLNTDTDGDSYPDGYEIEKGSDPTDPNSFPPPPPGVVEVAPDGAWTWFNDERAIFHNGFLYSGYVRSDGYAGVTRYDPATGAAIHMQLGTTASKEFDDHNNPSLTVLPDGRLLAVYSRHSTDYHFFHRTSKVANPASDSDWNAVQTVSTTARNSYANTYRLSAEANKLYNFHRDIDWNPTLTRSSDNGVTWDTPVHFIDAPNRPYPRYISNHSDRIDLIYTDGHPGSMPCWVYHLYYKAGEFCKTDGTVVKTLATLPLDHSAGERGTIVYPYSTAAWGSGDGPDDWIPSGRGWTWDIHYGTDGHPVCAFQVQINIGSGAWEDNRIYYYYARWTGTEWQRRFIAKAGRSLAGDNHYGGGMAIDPDDPRVVYISTDAANPFDLDDIYDHPLGPDARYEIWRGFTADGGLTFTWQPVTENSLSDNMRPIVPENHGRTRNVLWFNGTYASYWSFSTKVLGVFDDPKEEFTAWQTGFGIGGAALDDDSDGDGLEDLLEYALGSSPTDPEDTPFPTISSDRFSFHHLPPRTDAEWIVETAPDLLGAWTEIATVRAAGLPNDITAGYTLGTDGGDPALLTIEPTVASPQGFYRLKVRYGN